MVYLDNAATSFPKPDSVIKEVVNCLKEYCGNPGRSAHNMSVKAAEMIYETRETLSAFFNFPNPENIVFTYNATYALNMALKTCIKDGAHVIISDIEHNSVVRPLEKMMLNNGITYSAFSTDGNEDDVKNSIKSLINDKTSALVSTLTSNVTGKSISFKLLSEIAREFDLALIIDASQSVGHLKIDLNNAPSMALCAPGHKSLFGIQGCGFIIFTDKNQKTTFIEGGTGSDSLSKDMPFFLPDRFEAGTPSTPAIVSLLRGVEFINKVGIKNVSEKIEKLTEETKIRLDSIPGIRIYGADNGIISFNFGNIPSTLVAEKLNDQGVYVRSGYHCAPSVHKKLGTLNGGCVRVSLSYLNTINDIDRFYKSLSYIVKLS